MNLPRTSLAIFNIMIQVTMFDTTIHHMYILGYLIRLYYFLMTLHLTIHDIIDNNKIRAFIIKVTYYVYTV